ncbi:hypothetical protein MICAK_1910016 [Microcystis aeruginosa PCC 9701]|uniref:Uncharacterized protein n=1 Tax=Microcystis aeruginosa PCC 9701 TaxID=721123 RepID=I4INA0_MICAE|nr:hypothetical protein MICAK_1910016 [Microcystis aeruginosa PCC 9701]
MQRFRTFCLEHKDKKLYGILASQGKRILTILDKMNFMWVAYPDGNSGIFE